MKNNQKGFSLIEVIASIVIISIVLLSFFQLFIQTNKTAVANNEKLVVINLADAALERIKVTPIKEDPTIINVNDYFNNNSADPNIYPKSMILNNTKYNINYLASQSSNTLKNAKYSEKDLNLIKVVVTVTAENRKTKSSSEGYVSIEKSTKK